MARLLVIPIALLALLAGVFAWSGGGVRRPADFSFINRGDIGTLDPNRISWLQDVRVGYLIWEGLYAQDPVTLDPVPGAAATIDISPDKTVYTFHLRPEGKWSDGSGVVSQDFAFAWRRMLEEPGDYTYLLYYIKGAKEYADRFAGHRPANFEKVGIAPLDPLTLRVTLNHPVTFFPDLCAFPPFFPLHAGSMKKFRTYVDSDIMEPLFAAATTAREAGESADDRTLLDVVGKGIGRTLDASRIAELREFARVAHGLTPDMDDRAGLSRAIVAFERFEPFGWAPATAPAVPSNRPEPDKRYWRLALMAQSGSVRYSYEKKFTRPPNLVGNGPYRLASWEFKRNVRFEPNEHYWDRANVKSKTIDMVSADDPLASFLKYDSGAVDWQAEVNGDIAAQLRKSGRPDLHVFPGFGTYFYSVNCSAKLPDGRDNPLADVRVRQALSMAIDKQAIVDTITRMGEAPAANYVPLGIFNNYQAPTGLPFDLARARKLLADAGYPDGRGFPRIALLFNNEFNHGDIAQNVRRQWIDHLGVELAAEPVEIKTFRERLHKKDYAIARASWFGDYNDPSTFTDKYLSFSDNNDSNWKSEKYDALCAAAAVEGDADKRLRLLEQAESIVNAELPIIPVYYYVGAYLFRDNVKGIPLNPRNMLNFKSVQVVR